MGITMKVERIPTAINLGICHGAMPIIAYNYSSGNRERMTKTINTARIWGLAISGTAIVLFQLFAKPVTQVFMNIKAGGAALETIAFATLFLRIRCIASPFQFLNYHTSYSMQAMGNGKATIIHALVRELIFYIPFMFILDRLFGETGLAAALIAGEGCGALFAIWMLRKTLKKKPETA
ncbi:MAG: polysaccharide biosynthesis C-terminal domain-containing protein, partial [Clostridia bacterium]|nr:polysaccharide biosynthesis C-terminal domain-containing protein [Clostridia bacterium]